MKLFYLYLVCFTFSISYSMFPFHLVSNFFISSFSFDIFSQAFIKHSRKAFVYIHINSMYNIYILENLWILPN